MINYTELGIGLHEYLASEGVYLEQSQSGEWQANASDERVNNLIASYNPWGAEKAKKLLEINSWFQSEVEKLTAGTTQVERDSWSVQVSEAYGYRPISMLAAMAQARGIEVETLVMKVKAKAELFFCSSFKFYNTIVFILNSNKINCCWYIHDCFAGIIQKNFILVTPREIVWLLSTGYT